MGLKRKPRIGMIVHQNYFRDSRVRRYAEALVESGAEVDVLCVPEEQVPTVPLPPGLQVHHIPYHRGTRSQMSYIVEYVIALTLYSLWLIPLYFRRHFDVIHVHNMPDFLVFATVIPRLFGAKIILDIHDPTPEFYQSRFQKKSKAFFLKFFRFQERLSCSYANTVLTANSNFKEHIVGRGIPENKIHVIRNLPDPRFFNRQLFPHKGSEPGIFTLLYPGTLAPRYGLDTAIRAMPELVKKVPGIRLLIVGAPSVHSEDLARLIIELGASSIITMRPAVPIGDVPPLMAGADAGIYPALPDSHMTIATPSKVLEYAAMGLPIISSRIFSVQQHFPEDCVLYFDPGNVSQFIECAAKLAGDAQLRETLIHKTDELFFARYSWDVEVKEYFNLLNKLLPSKRQIIIS